MRITSLRLFAIHGILLVSAVALLWTQSSEAAKPRIRTTPEVFDFGHVPEGHTVFHRYWLVNDGDDTLIVSSVKPQCGCTTVPLLTDRLAPSDSVPLDLSFSSKKMKGRVNKAVRIWSNDESQSPAIISFTATIAEADPSIQITPPIARLTSIDKLEQIIELRNKSDSSYTIQFAVQPPAYLHCQLSSDSLLAGASVTLTLTVGEGVPLGDYQTSLTLLFDGDASFPVTIPVRGIGFIQ